MNSPNIDNPEVDPAFIMFNIRGTLAMLPSITILYPSDFIKLFFKHSEEKLISFNYSTHLEGIT